MAVRTYGDKPISFQLEENGEYYCVGSEVSFHYAAPNSAFRSFFPFQGGQLPAPLPGLPLQKVPGHVPPAHHQRGAQAADRARPEPARPGEQRLPAPGHGGGGHHRGQRREVGIGAFGRCDVVNHGEAIGTKRSRSTRRTRPCRARESPRSPCSGCPRCPTRATSTPCPRRRPSIGIGSLLRRCVSGISRWSYICYNTCFSIFIEGRPPCMDNIS